MGWDILSYPIYGLEIILRKGRGYNIHIQKTKMKKKRKGRKKKGKKKTTNLSSQKGGEKSKKP